MLRGVLPHDPRAAHRVAPGVGQRRGHHRQVRRGDDQRALAEVGVQDVVDVAAQRPGAAHQVGDRAVAVAGPALGREDRLVDLERAAGERRQARRDPLEPAAHERGGEDRARVDERVRRAPRPRLEADRVERLAARLGPDARVDLVEPEVLERERVHERLGDRLDRERRGRVAHGVGVALVALEHDPELRRVGARELRDVVGQRALAGVGDAFLPERVERPRDRVAHDANVLQADGRPCWSPVRTQRTRSAEEPCVHVSGASSAPAELRW